METKDAISAARIAVNQAKALVKMGEVLDLIEEKERILKDYNGQIERLEGRIANGQNELSKIQAAIAQEKESLKTDIAAQKQQVINDFQTFKANVENQKTALDKALAESKLNFEGEMAPLRETLSRIESEIAEKKNSLKLLKDSLRSAAGKVKSLTEEVQGGD